MSLGPQTGLWCRIFSQSQGWEWSNCEESGESRAIIIWRDKKFGGNLGRRKEKEAGRAAEQNERVGPVEVQNHDFRTAGDESFDISPVRVQMCREIGRTHMIFLIEAEYNNTDYGEMDLERREDI